MRSTPLGRITLMVMGLALRSCWDQSRMLPPISATSSASARHFTGIKLGTRATRLSRRVMRRPSVSDDLSVSTWSTFMTHPVNNQSSLSTPVSKVSWVALRHSWCNPVLPAERAAWAPRTTNVGQRLTEFGHLGALFFPYLWRGSFYKLQQATA